MAKRLVFIAEKERIGVTIQAIDFRFYTGFSISQKQKSIESLHAEAGKLGITKILEVSTKSKEELGVRLSAFILTAMTKKYGFEFTVERAFQASKVFEGGGPFRDLLEMTSSQAKTDPRLKTSGNLIGFRFCNYSFNKEPPTFFYDWLYINTLLENSELIESVSKYHAFSDIEFNQDKSINCQAYSLALFNSLRSNGSRIDELRDPNSFLSTCLSEYSRRWGRDYSVSTQKELDF